MQVLRNQNQTAANHKKEDTLHNLGIISLFLSSLVLASHNWYKFIGDTNYIYPFPLNKGQGIFKDAAVFYLSTHLSTIFLFIHMLCSRINKKAILIFTLIEFAALMDCRLTCNRDYLFPGFDVNTIKMLAYGGYCAVLILRPEKLKYDPNLDS